MAWNGSGNFQRTNGSFSGVSVWEDDANAGFDIVDSRHDNHDQDLAQGINNCLTKDGQNSPTADLSMNTFKHTNVGDGTARNHYATIGQLQDQAVQALSSVGGTQNAITATTIPAISAYVTGAQYTFKAISSNSGPTTLKIGTGSVLAVQWRNAALTGGEIAANAWHTVVYDGSLFQLLNPVDVTGPIWGGTTAGTSTAFTLTPTPAISTYAAGLRITFTANAANGAAATLAVSGLTAKTIQRQGTALVGNEFKSGDMLEVEYDGTNFQLLNVASAPLFVDRTNNRVGIGTTAPSSALQVSGTIDNTPDSAGVHLGVTGGFASIELCEATGANIDFTTAGTDIKGRIQYTHSTDTMAFLTANSERLRVTGAGRVGIGTNPGHYFVAANSESNAIATASFLSNVSGDVSTHALLVTKFDSNNSTSQRLVGFLINQGATQSGQINANNAGQAAFGSFSDVRLKENITDLPSQLVNIMALRPVEFDYKDGSGHQIGFVAQEVEDIYPDLIGDDGNGYLTLSGLGKNEARMIKAFQEFASLVDAKIAALEARVEALEA